MSVAGPIAFPLATRQGPAATSVLLLLACGAISLCTLWVTGSTALAVAPVLPAVIYCGATLPLRTTGAAVLFLSLSLEVKTDAAGLWHTPLALFGDLLRDNLAETIGIPGMKIAGIEALLAFLLGVNAWRKASGSTIDGYPGVPTAPVLRDVMLIYVAAVLFAFANGLTTGGSLALWQLRRLAQVPLYFAFFQVAFRGPSDHAFIGKAIVAAASLKGALAVVAQRVAVSRTGGELAHATNHGDSILFSLGILIVVLHVLERPDRARMLRAAPPLLLMLLGVRDNNRRIAFVELGMALAAAFLLAPRVRWRRELGRAALVAIPLVLLYVGIGWTSTSGRFFAPVGKLKSLVDTQRDHSTAWRSVENRNIAMSIRERPLLGLGLGKEYTEFVPNDDISWAYPEFRYWPHNSILGLLLFGGLLAFTGIWSLFVVCVFLAVRSLRRATVPDDRVAALCAVGAIVCCVVHAYGDLGAAFTQSRLFEGLALAVAGKLAVATGAWPVDRARVGRPAPKGRFEP